MQGGYCRSGRNRDRINIEVIKNGNQSNLGKNRKRGSKTTLSGTTGIIESVE
jgi:hypothetical protein